MWLLSSEGDLFSHRRLWLRPGSAHLLGRTSGHPGPGERVSFIEHKSVSRKHLVIRVAALQPNDHGLLHKRTQVTLEDNSKIGTTVNGEKFCKGSKILETGEKEFRIRLGNYEQEFRLAWVPIVVSFTGLSKKGRTGGAGEGFAEQKEKVTGADIKLATEFVANETTHVVAKKRNVPATLQALVQGRWVVAPAWFDALATAMRPKGAAANEEVKRSLLEEDFDAYWPKEEDYPVPAGSEPVARPAEMLKPREDRAEVFKDFIFIFLSKSQYDTLLPVVTIAHGKALLWEVQEERSKPEDLISYVAEVMGRKGDNDFRLSQQTGRGGIVLVRLGGDRGEWDRKFMQQTELATEQRMIEQSEFLDPILTLDTSALRQPLKEVDSPVPESAAAEVASRPKAQATSSLTTRQDPAVSNDQSPTVARKSSQRQPQGADEGEAEQAALVESAPMPTKKKWSGRIVTKSRWQGFDDDFEASEPVKQFSPSPEPAPSVQYPSQAPQVADMEIDEPGHTQHTPRKRPIPPEEEEEQMLEALLPGQAALKKRRVEAARAGEITVFAQSSSKNDDSAGEITSAKSKKKAEGVNIRAEIAKRTEEEEEQRRREEETLHEQLGSIDLSEIRNKIKIEEVPVLHRQTRAAETAHDDRWDPAWNGRKNFKKFRRRGRPDDANPSSRHQRVIVPLEEVPRKAHGIGHEYWLPRHDASNKDKGKGKARAVAPTQTQTQTHTLSADPQSAAAAEQDMSESARLQRRIQRSWEEDEEEAENAMLAEQFAGHAQTQPRQAKITQAATLQHQSQRSASGKRAAATQLLVQTPPVKKTRQTRVPAARVVVDLNQEEENIEGDDDDDDDGLKFRRRNR